MEQDRAPPPLHLAHPGRLVCARVRVRVRVRVRIRIRIRVRVGFLLNLIIRLIYCAFLCKRSL